jgi:hypothetical protein
LNSASRRESKWEKPFEERSPPSRGLAPADSEELGIQAPGALMYPPKLLARASRGTLAEPSPRNLSRIPDVLKPGREQSPSARYYHTDCGEKKSKRGSDSLCDRSVLHVMQAAFLKRPLNVRHKLLIAKNDEKGA